MLEAAFVRGVVTATDPPHSSEALGQLAGRGLEPAGVPWDACLAVWGSAGWGPSRGWGAAPSSRGQLGPRLRVSGRAWKVRAGARQWDPKPDWLPRCGLLGRHTQTPPPTACWGPQV